MPDPPPPTRSTDAMLTRFARRFLSKSPQDEDARRLPMSHLRWLVTLSLLAFMTPVRGAETKRPNVLWIVADAHAPYVMGAYGNRQVRTPHLDGLAAHGLRCDRAFCNMPVC